MSIKKLHFKDGNDKSIANTLNNIGMTYQNISKPYDAFQYFNQSIDIYKKIYGEEYIGVTYYIYI